MIRAAIVGASGYTGAELMRDSHLSPGDKRNRGYGPPVRGGAGFIPVPFASWFLRRAFHRVRLDRARKRLRRGFRGTASRREHEARPGAYRGRQEVVDLSADFRLADPALYERWYGTTHACPELLAEAAYGLPEINRVHISKARLVANPGCYPTAAIIALRPLCGRVTAVGTVVVDAKSGVSGRAGALRWTRTSRRRLTAWRHTPSRGTGTCPRWRRGLVR